MEGVVLFLCGGDQASRQLLPDCPCPIVNMVNLMLGYCWLRYLYSILGADG